MHKKSIRYTPIQPEIRALAQAHENDPEAVLEVLQALEEQHGYLTSDVILDVARSLKVPSARAQGIATFYSMLATELVGENRLRVCDGPPCWLKGSKEILSRARESLGENWHVERTSCLGLCDRAPAGWLNGQQIGPLSSEPLQKALSGAAASPNGRTVQALLEASPPHPDYRTPRKGETRVMLNHIDEIDPTSIESALQHGGYQALETAVAPKDEAPILPSQEVVSAVKASGVRGRGGAGFPTGLKLELVAKESRTPKYIVCNADESEPLVFKDRVLIETKPHQLLEGMALAAYAVGASQGFIYIRGEYGHQAQLLERAIAQAEARGFLGEGILGTDFSFHIHVHRGAGAYICGEETALLESLEGKRGEPRIRPPYPTVSGYHGLPTVVNNVETFCAVPHIVLNGPDWYRGLSRTGTPGTKLFTITGHVNNPGAFEAPYGMTLREMVATFAGGLKSGSEFHFALCGGAAGTIIPESLLDVPVDYEASKKGLSLGAGAFLICDRTVSVVEMLRELMRFFEVESCGKCTPCRVGTHQARVLLERMVAGERNPQDVELLRALAQVMGDDSFCGLGMSTRLPILSALEHFSEAFE